MKLTFYIDTYPGMDPKHVYANAMPGKKMNNATRYRIDFEIPDPSKPDVIVDGLDVEVTEVADADSSKVSSLSGR